ncbi:MAG TPA: biotin/lipoyl-containing protein [Bdellovibrionota bacterium]|jgi:acetyl/propionyl-CoA carboxylase alpha subunit|nr:biotin/lipoyl-containing protein [Bdellovibrionota bacterium]
MSGMRGKVGESALVWKTVPRGPEGTAEVEVGGKTHSVSWKQDGDGLWLEFADRIVGFDIRSVKGDDGSQTFDLNGRGYPAEWRGIRFLREGEEAVSGAGSGKSNRAKVRAEMPGKVSRLFVTEGQVVAKGERLLVMEAMKMENEIVSPVPGRVTGLGAKAGESVESGALLLTVEPEKS